MTNQTGTITTQFVNNSTVATILTTAKVVPLVVVNNNLVPDFRQRNPGVIGGVTADGANTDGKTPLNSVFAEA